MQLTNLTNHLKKIASDFQNQKNLSNTPDENGQTNQRDVHVANQAIQMFLDIEQKFEEIKIEVQSYIKHFEKRANNFLVEEEGVRKINPRASETAAWAAKEFEGVLAIIEEMKGDSHK